MLAQSGGTELEPHTGPIQAGIAKQAEKVTLGLGGNLAWPALLRKLDRTDPSYKD